MESAAFSDTDVIASRVAFAHKAAQVLSLAGRGFSALGLAEGGRRAVSIAVQFAGEIALGAVDLLTKENWYASSALVRQLVELEYLLFLFATDAQEATRWLSASPADLRHVYSPAAMRKRSGGQFRDAEYWTHCEVGGHPHWKAAVLLPERVEAMRFPAREVLWLDIAHHLTRILHTLDDLVCTHSLLQIAVVREALAMGRDAYNEWVAADPAATKAPDSIGRALDQEE